MENDLLRVEGLTHDYRLPGGGKLRALDGVSLRVGRGEIFGLVGESGSGKSTLALCVMGLLRPTAGEIVFNGETVRPGCFGGGRGGRQMVFQDAASSLSGRMRVWEIVAEPLEIHRIGSRKERRDMAAEQLRAVGLDGSFLDRHPAELSGGQRQRAAIARALMLEPSLLLADEPVAALDVSVQAQILNLFLELQKKRGFSLLFIAHDLAAVRAVCRRAGVLYRGRLVETGPAASLFSHPLHPYTQALLDAVPIPDPRRERGRIRRVYDETACPLGDRLVEASPGHFVLAAGEEAEL